MSTYTYIRVFFHLADVVSARANLHLALSGRGGVAVEVGAVHAAGAAATDRN